MHPFIDAVRNTRFAPGQELLSVSLARVNPHFLDQWCLSQRQLSATVLDKR